MTKEKILFCLELLSQTLNSRANAGEIEEQYFDRTGNPIESHRAGGAAYAYRHARDLLEKLLNADKEDSTNE